MLKDLFILLNSGLLFIFFQNLQRREEVDSGYNNEERRKEMFDRFLTTKSFVGR